MDKIRQILGIIDNLLNRIPAPIQKQIFQLTMALAVVAAIFTAWYGVKRGTQGAQPRGMQMAESTRALFSDSTAKLKQKEMNTREARRFNFEFPENAGQTPRFYSRSEEGEAAQKSLVERNDSFIDFNSQSAGQGAEPSVEGRSLLTAPTEQPATAETSNRLLRPTAPGQTGDFRAPSAAPYTIRPLPESRPAARQSIRRGNEGYPRRFSYRYDGAAPMTVTPGEGAAVNDPAPAAGSPPGDEEPAGVAAPAVNSNQSP